jgi:hypothetical protein
MSKIDRDKLLLLLDEMSKGEATQTTRELRNYELDFANGGLVYANDKEAHVPIWFI